MILINKKIIKVSMKYLKELLLKIKLFLIKIFSTTFQEMLKIYIAATQKNRHSILLTIRTIIKTINK